MNRHHWRRSISAVLSGGGRRRSAAATRRQPALEPLESRRLLSSITEFPVPNRHTDLDGIAVGPYGKVWFTEGYAGMIGMLDPTTHVITEYPIPTAPSYPEGIATGPDGKIWFTEYRSDKIGTIDPTTHTITDFSTPTSGSQPQDIAVGPDGKLWFTEYGSNAIGSIDSTTGAIAEYPLPTAGADPEEITASPDGNLWFTEPTGGNIGVLVPSLALSVMAQPTSLVAPGAAFGLTVSVSYQTGRPDTAFDGDITLALADPGGATLGGTITVAAHDGVATFAGLSIDRPGTYRIIASLDPQTTTMTAAVVVDAPPTIVAAAPMFAGKGRHKRLVGYELDFSAAMDPAGAASATNYGLVQFQRRRHRLVAQPVSVQASYDAATHRVTLTLLGRPKFAAGGELVVDPAGGLGDAAGTSMEAGGVTFVIARKGKGLSR